MKSFLVLTKDDGSIIEIKWCDPNALIDERTNLIQDIFEVDQRDSVLHFILNAPKDTSDLSFFDNLRLFSDETPMKLFCVSSNNGVYVFAIEQQFCSDPTEHAQLHDVVSRFMFLVQMNDQKYGFKNPESTRFQFEEIQMLNNALVNTKRMLEKSNGQLNMLNRELNNRLVKDPLTGLVSRYQYRSEIEYQITQHQDKLGVFMFMDIDEFKSINDTYGHGVGDSYLVEFAHRLKKMPLPNSVKLRIAGDEFGVFIYGLQSVDNSDLQSYWGLIETYIIKEPFLIGHHKLRFSLSVGMAIYGIDTKEIFEIIEYADFAMYCAKKGGKKKYCRFDLEEYKNKKIDNR